MSRKFPFKEISVTSHRGCSARVSVISVSSPFPLETLKRVSLTTVPLSVALLCGCARRNLATQTPKAAHREQLQSGCFALRVGRAEVRRGHPGDTVRWAQAVSPWPPRGISTYYAQLAVVDGTIIVLASSTAQLLFTPHLAPMPPPPLPVPPALLPAPPPDAPPSPPQPTASLVCRFITVHSCGQRMSCQALHCTFKNVRRNATRARRLLRTCTGALALYPKARPAPGGCGPDPCGRAGCRSAGWGAPPHSCQCVGRVGDPFCCSLASSGAAFWPLRHRGVAVGFFADIGRPI